MADDLKVLECPQDGDIAKRIQSLKEKFVEKFDREPKIFVRAPGRVNLIGEHIDYCGYGVLPMAIEQHILVAACPTSSSTISLANTNAEYQFFSCSTKEIGLAELDVAWYKYFLCGVAGVVEELVDKDEDLIGMDVLVEGNIPPSSGLSSSSALVCAAAITTAFVNTVTVGMKQLAEVCARCERYMGTMGGGMDQAICLLAQKGTAKQIEFNPLRTTEVTLPAGATFVVANCLAPINKAAGSLYNERVVECRLACQLVAKSKGQDWRNLKILADLQKALKVTGPEIIDLVKEILKEEPYTKQEVCETLQLTEDELNELSLSDNTRHMKTFKLRQRALHVFSEAHRVKEFARICAEAPEDALHQLGSLMFDSHNSTQNLYECSHEKLDELVELSRPIAFGARLTGAGWGGCMVALVPSEKTSEYRQLLAKEFFAKEGLEEGPGLEKVLFETSPGPAACVFTNAGSGSPSTCATL